jgi:hypothetical protein
MSVTVKELHMKKTIKMRWWMLPVVGLLLLLLAVQSMALGVAGRTTHAEVTSVKQVVDSQSSRMDYNYNIAYRFSVNGKTYSGSARRNKVYNAGTLPSTGATIAIHYLPSWPHINGDKSEGPMQALLLGALGLGLVIAGFRFRKKGSSQEAESV